MSTDRPVPLHAVVSVICDSLANIPPKQQAHVLDLAFKLSREPVSVQAVTRAVFDVVAQLSPDDQLRAVESTRMLLGVFAECSQKTDCPACLLVSEFAQSLRRPDQHRLMEMFNMSQKILLMEILRMADPSASRSPSSIEISSETTETNSKP